jgi:hypothetical protein
MKGLVHSPSVQYAVLQVSSTKDPQRLVIGYRDEKSLCDLIAERSIVGFGFASHEEAAAAAEGGFPNTTVWNEITRPTPSVHGYQKYLLTFRSVRRGLADAFSISTSRRIARSILQFAVATAILTFYSKNIVSATIRAMLGGSF